MSRLMGSIQPLHCFADEPLIPDHVRFMRHLRQHADIRNSAGFKQPLQIRGVESARHQNRPDFAGSIHPALDSVHDGVIAQSVHLIEARCRREGRFKVSVDRDHAVIMPIEVRDTAIHPSGREGRIMRSRICVKCLEVVR